MISHLADLLLVPDPKINTLEPVLKSLELEQFDLLHHVIEGVHSFSHLHHLLLTLENQQQLQYRLVSAVELVPGSQSLDLLPLSYLDEHCLQRLQAIVEYHVPLEIHERFYHYQQLFGHHLLMHYEILHRRQSCLADYVHSVALVG